VALRTVAPQLIENEGVWTISKGQAGRIPPIGVMRKEHGTMPKMTDEEKEAVVRLITRDVKALIEQGELHRYVEIPQRIDQDYNARLVFYQTYSDVTVKREVKPGP
jgi:hypothetical protein